MFSSFVCLTLSKVKQCGAPWQIRWIYDYLLQHSVHLDITNAAHHRTYYVKT